jgi:glycine/D-amino acid oxidase-like deaminating enzyme/nitrite reductase/ring-hydroxylating ferredoxin subunit
MADRQLPEFPSLEKNLSCDICVIGAGIAGITTTYLLAKKGADVILLEKGRILRGETERTTAHLSNAIDDRYYEIDRIHGQDRMRLVAQSHSEAIEFIERAVKEEDIDCDFRRLDGYLFVGKGADPSELDKELDAVHRAGLLTVEKLPHLRVRDIDLGPCLRFPHQGQFHPTRYLSALALAAQKHGARIFTQSTVEGIEEDDQPVKIRVSGNHTVTAQKLIVTTNAPINDNVAIYSKQAPYRTFAIGFAIPKRSIQTALFWDTLDAYHYIRLKDGDPSDGHDVLIVGGEDHKTGQEDDMEKRLKNLEKWTRTHFPAVEEVMFRWSGQVFETADGLAMIGRKPLGKPWSFLATGDSGMGMTHGTIAGLMLSDMARGETHPWEDVYDPGRTRVGSLGKLLRENMNVGKVLVSDWVKPGEVQDPDEIKPGSGAVIRNGITKIALYRDDAGDFHACSAVCPHKGCIIQWNDGEKSWDCPCHGSRYSNTGEVLTGPTRSPLEPLPDWKKQ